MASDLPYIKFFVNDWLSDEKLRMCSLAARGLWMDLICVAHKSGRRGHLQQANGQPLSREQIARIASCSPEEVDGLLQELIDSETASVTKAGVVYSRRIERDEYKRKIRSKAGRKGGLRTGNLLKQNAKQNSSKSEANTQAKCGSMDSVLDDPQLQAEEELGGAGEEKPHADDGFAAFWAAWPKKVARQDAERAWGKLRPSPELQAVILAAVARWRQTEQWAVRGVIPNPATWLNGKRWNDEVPGVHQGNGQAQRSKIEAAIEVAEALARKGTDG